MTLSITTLSITTHNGEWLAVLVCITAQKVLKDVLTLASKP
jgi:hypothetical protein